MDYISGSLNYYSKLDLQLLKPKMSQSQKTVEFLQKLKDIGHWNDDYDYSEVDYINNSTKVLFLDKKLNTKHFMSPAKMLSRGVFTGIINAIDRHEYLLAKLKSDGLFNENYDYSKFDVESTKLKSLVINKDFGTEHLMNYESLISGVKCGIKNAIDKNTFLIREFEKKNKDKYDYSKVVYKDDNYKVIVICRLHGEFMITPTHHKQGKGCPKCIGRVNEYIDLLPQLNIITNNEYNFIGLSKTTSKKEKIDIIYKKYNTLHKISIEKILQGVRVEIRNAVDKNEFVKKQFQEVHGNIFDYSEINYVNETTNISIRCLKHGVFYLTPNEHKQGRGCQVCNSGWNTQRIINFINDIKNEDVLNMDPVELNMLIAQGKLPKEFEELVFTLEGTKENSLKTLKENLGIDDSHELSDSELENLSDKLESMTMSSYDDEINDALVAIETLSGEDLEFSRQEERKRQGLPSISNDDILVLDKELINTCDDEAVEFFIQYKLKRVRNEIINDKREVKDIRDLNGGKNSTRLRDLFLSEYKKVVDYIPPTGYNFKRNGEIAFPNMMQKLTVQRVIDYKRYGNWSGTGAGKTISFIIASREVNSRLTIVICINSTVSQLEEDILDVYPDSKIFTHFRKGQKFNRDNYNYLLLNYEKFQQGYTEEIFQDLNENNLIDFIVLDEVHNAKQRDKDESIRRGALMRLIGRSAEMNPNFHLLGMSATPVINNLIEAKSLLQLITGKDYEDISTRGTITNALKIFNQLLLNGIRYIPKYDIVLKELTAENTPALNIDGTKLTEKLKDNDNKDYLGLEKILLESKLEVLEEFLKPKTIIYTYFTDNDKIPKRIAKYVKSKGYSCGLYIGEQSTEDREHSKTSFVKGDVDILIASRIIGTGVDGLQNVCNRMILLTLPWTDSEYTQLKGRIYRQGSKFGDVEIVIPQVFVDLDDKRWSWDKQRLQLIREKRTLADAAVDGIIPSKHIPSRERLCSDSLQALKIWKDRVSEGKITTIERNDLVLPLRPEILEYLKPSLGDFSEMNKSWSVSRSENTKNRLIKDPSEWYYYHSLYAEKRKEWSEIPYVEIAKKIKERPEWIVADMGCGENLLSKELTNQVHAFDYVAIDKNVIACDMSSVPLNSQEVDAVVFCLSLMGSNYLDYLKEAFRIIKPYGNLFICEPKKKIDNRIEDFKKDIESVGFKIIEVNSHSSKFIYFQGIKL